MVESFGAATYPFLPRQNPNPQTLGLAKNAEGAGGIGTLEESLHLHQYSPRRLYDRRPWAMRSSPHLLFY